MSSAVASMFEFATRKKLRFQSKKGQLTLEELWDVPLRSNDTFNLNEIARGINSIYKQENEENFVDGTKSPGQHRLQVALEVVKHVISVKLAEKAADRRRIENKQEKEKLMKILAEKQDGRLSELSEAELRNRIQALESELNIASL